MTPPDIEAGHRERTAQRIRLADLMVAGHPADAEPVQAETDARYRALTELRPVSAEEYRTIGRARVANDAWYAAYKVIAPGLAAYQRDGIETYTSTRLR